MLMQIEVLMIPQVSGNWEMFEKRVVVLDILRATSTIVTALGNKALEVIPTIETDEVIELAKTLGSSECVTGGERKGMKITGFDLGNSPLEYTPAKVAGKKVIMSTTNGTRAIKSAQGASEVLIGSFLNLQILVDHLKKVDQDTLIICSGRNNYLSLEDLACAGAIIDRLQEQVDNEFATDATKLSHYVWKHAQHDLEGFINATQHGRYLKEIGMEADLSVCSAFDEIPILPRYQNGKISL